MASYSEIGATLRLRIEGQEAQQQRIAKAQHFTATTLPQDPIDNLRDMQLRAIDHDLPELWDAYRRANADRCYDKAAEHLVQMILGVRAVSRADEQQGQGDPEFISSRAKSMALLTATIDATSANAGLRTHVATLYGYPMEAKWYFPNHESPIVTELGQIVLVETLLYVHGVQHREGFKFLSLG